MKNRIIKGDPRSTKHGGKQQEPHRVASRMEGVVKNKGTKTSKKPAKDS